MEKIFIDDAHAVVIEVSGADESIGGSCGLVEPARFSSLSTLTTRTSRWRESRHGNASNEEGHRARFDSQVT